MFKPVGERVLVEQLVEETKSGIILQDEDARRVPKGKVIDIGMAIVLKDSIYYTTGAPVKIGDTIHFNSMAGEELKDGDKKYLVIKLSDVLAIETNG